jgi:hypothetical protein
MSEIDEVLQLFGFLTLDEITPEDLKRAFRVNIIRVHPDKGGSPELFDKMLRSYVYLTETVQRVYGGRTTLQNIVSPDELKGMRVNEIVNRFFEEFDREMFNKLFEEQESQPSQQSGYEGWLKNKEADDNLIDGKYGAATQKEPDFPGTKLNEVFEAAIRANGHKKETHDIIIHPEAMAYISGQTLGTEIIETVGGDYTSAPFLRPEYTDVYTAFTSNNTISDKIPDFEEATKSIEELIAEREKDREAVVPLTNSELAAIQEYERKKLDNNVSHMAKVKTHFNHETNIQNNLTNWPAENYPSEAYKGFVVDL